MAITPLVSEKLGDAVAGYQLRVGSIAGPSSYATGGFAASLSDLGLSSADVVAVFASSQYLATYDSANSKIKALKVNTTSGLLEEAAAATDLSSITFFILAINQN